MKRRLMWIAWPAFLVAAGLELVVFAFVDPQQLHDLAGEPLQVSRVAVYTLAFFAFWLPTMASSALTTLLAASPFEIDRRAWEATTQPPPSGAAGAMDAPS